jgi:hypothetical protein
MVDLSSLFGRMCRTGFPMAPFPVSCRYFVDTNRASVRRTNVTPHEAVRVWGSTGYTTNHTSRNTEMVASQSLIRPRLQRQQAAGLTKPASGIVLHAAQQVVEGEINVCIVSWQHVVCAARLLNRGNCSGPPARFCTHDDACNSANGMSNRVATLVVHNCERHNVRVQWRH